jgi:MFS family permease
MYFVYTPIWVAQSGYGPEAGGLLVSAGQLPMLAVRAWAALGQRYGLRRLLALGYAGCGIATLAVGTMMGWPIVAMACICLAALFATMIDGAGNVPFLRAVRPLERSEMTAVFMTFRQVGSLAPTAVYFGVLMFAPLPFVYITSGLIALAMAGLSLKLSRGL